MALALPGSKSWIPPRARSGKTKRSTETIARNASSSKSTTPSGPATLTKPASTHAPARLDAGTDVGVLARQCYPGGVLVDVEYFKVAEGLDRTAALLADLSITVVYEGFLQFDNVVVRLSRAAGD